MHRHKKNIKIAEARERSGKSKGKHGLTPEQEQNRKERNDARRNYFWALELKRELEASKDRGKGKGKRGAAEHASKGKGKGKPVAPRGWWQMSPGERWWLKELRPGKLREEVVRAAAKCDPVQADPFVVEDSD